MENKVTELLKNSYVLLDGAMGTMLQKNGLKLGELPEAYNIEKPDLIKKISTAYAKAGAMVLSTNTFGANAHKLKNSPYSVKEIIAAGVKITKEVAAKYGCLTALDIGPIGEMLQPLGSLSFDNAYAIFKEQIETCEADLIIIETMTDLNEMRAAVLAAKENSKLPVFCMMTFEKNTAKKEMRTFLGVSPKEAALVLEGLGADAVGVNCSLAPTELVEIVRLFAEYTRLPIIAKPNAGLPNLNSNDYDLSPSQFAADASALLDAGASVIGGCCGTTPEYISMLKAELQKHKFKQREQALPVTAVCSATETVVIDGVKIIGERLNPTGKKLLKEALRTGDTDYILKTAIGQVDAGADILDINVGLPDIDEMAVMTANIKALQGFVSCPLQIDSANKDVIEAALRVYNGKAIVNSVNGEDKVLDDILPIVKKYGACVVGLTLNQDGIPATANERYLIAKHILDKALEYGIKKENVIIDCLTLTASAQQSGALETLSAIKLVKEKLGLKTVLGVSNISFGLPQREIINASFLTMAMSAGLDLPIVNPNVKSVTDAVFCFNVLSNRDKNCTDFIAYSNKFSSENLPLKAALTTSPSLNIGGNKENLSTAELLFNAVKLGLRDDAKAGCEALLKQEKPMSIIDGVLIPALDAVGTDFGNGTLFLPQLILSAQAVEGAFEIIKNKISASPATKGKIVLATVKGDIHDIGKNIVKVLLESYGFTVIDLGKDVAFEAVIEAVKVNKPFLIGLSALMTTTVKNMETTIKMLKEQFPKCKILVGGAVLTAEYAKKISADFYANDAKESVDIANRLC
ncbi:MAG: homocysteine S-methyltransferase family protein [Hydrogenoanaerobacterium sp.]